MKKQKYITSFNPDPIEVLRMIEDDIKPIQGWRSISESLAKHCLNIEGELITIKEFMKEFSK